jgi:hypothetical protein
MSALRARIEETVRLRPTLVAAALYAVLALALFSPGLVPGRTLSGSDYLWTATPWTAERPADVPLLGSNREVFDSATQFQPALLWIRRSLPDIPLWDPGTLSGRPLLGDPQTGIFSIFSVPAYVLPFWKSLAVMAALKVFVGALGAFLLARLIGMSFGGALLTGLVFGFSLWQVTWVSWPHSGVWAFLPWLCLLCELCVRRPGPLPFAGLATVVGFQFLAGHPSSSSQILFVVGLFWAGRVLLARQPWRWSGVRFATLAAALVVGTALAAAMLIPFAELLAHSNDASLRSSITEFFKEPPRYLFGFLLHDYWGHGRSALEFASQLPERAYYVGALPLMLALVALLARPARERVAVALFGAVAVAVATGTYPFYDLVLKLPGFSAAHNGRFAVIAVLSLAVLAGWGLDDLAGGRLTAGRRWLATGLAAVLFVLPIVVVGAAGRIKPGAFGDALEVAWGFATATAEGTKSAPGGLAEVVKLASLFEWVVVAGAALALLVLRLRGRLGVTPFVALALGLVVVDLFSAGMGYNPGIPVSHAEQPETAALRFLDHQRPARFTALKPETPLSFSAPLPPNSSMRYGLYDTRGYVIPTEERYSKIWRRSIVSNPSCYYIFCTSAAAATPTAAHALGLFGVDYLLQNQGDPPLPLPGAKVAYEGPDARVYTNPGALPRAFLVDRQRVVGGGAAALAAVTDASFPTRSVAVTETELPGLAKGEATGQPEPGGARIEHYGDERVVVRADAARPALLVLTDPWYPGWKARVDGREVPIHRVDYLIRGVSVPAGRHEVEFRYEPASWRAGWILSLCALLVILAAAAVGVRRGARSR